jgi:hypothetical protein
MTRFTQAALMRTLKNRRAGFMHVAKLHHDPDQRERFFDGVRLFDAIAPSLQHPKLSKKQALLILGRAASPTLVAGAQVALAGLRTAVTAVDLDEVNEVVDIKAAAQKFEELALLSGDSPRVKKAQEFVAKLIAAGVTEVHFRGLWEDIDQLVGLGDA